jgi:hypothetical protein
MSLIAVGYGAGMVQEATPPVKPSRVQQGLDPDD